jgi:hypothetical protein
MNKTFFPTRVFLLFGVINKLFSDEDGPGLILERSLFVLSSKCGSVCYLIQLNK